MRYFVGITGASGTIYGVRLAQHLLSSGHTVFVCFSKAAKKVACEELDLPQKGFQEALLSRFFSSTPEPVLLEEEEINTPPASGSAGIQAVFIAPCSTSTLCHIAFGTTRNLIHRAADVALKEKRRLVLVVRETPLSRIHLRAMVYCCEAGAVILPASPAFYHRPSTVEEMIDFVVGKALDAAGIGHSLFKRYKVED